MRAEEFCILLKERRKALADIIFSEFGKDMENKQNSRNEACAAQNNFLDVDAEVENQIKSIAAYRYERLINDIELQVKGPKLPGINDKETKIGIDKMIHLYLKRQSNINKDSNSEKNREKLCRLLETARSQKNSRNTIVKKLKGSASRKIRPAVSQGFTKHIRRVQCFNGKSEKSPVDHWPSGFLTHGGVRRRLTTAQICEYVREWQACNQNRLRKVGRGCSWIDRVEDWSSVTHHALDFLTAESPPESIIRNSSRRLVCPRPFVNLKPRIHQWCWLLYPPSGINPKVDQEWIQKFGLETSELTSLFSDWLRAPRGLGGLTDAVLSISDSLLVSGRNKVKPNKNTNSSIKEKQYSEESDGDGGVEDSEIDEGEKCLRIDECQAESDDGDKKSGDIQKIRRNVSSKHSQQSISHEDNRLYSDDDIPPPLYPTRWKLRPFSEEEKADFQLQEAERFSHPWSPFVYHIQNYCAVVGPLRSAPSPLSHDLALYNSGRNWSSHSKARDHPLLRLDRPMFVSLAEIVRDAVACLPNGEGTRADITTIVQNSGFLLPNVNPRQLQQCVSSALDRLQGETSDPSVYFNNNRRMWIYRHRHRTFEKFAELHEARCAVNETKKIIQRGGSTSVLNINKTVKPTNQLIPDKYSEYSSKQSNLRHNSSKFSGRYHNHHHSGRHIQSGYISRDYGYMELNRNYSFIDDDHIPDIEELEAADEVNMMEYNCTSANYSMNSNNVKGHIGAVVDNTDYDDGNEMDEVEYENEILGAWDDDNSTDRIINHPTGQQKRGNQQFNKIPRYLDPFQSRSPTSFILPSNNYSQSTISNYKQSRLNDSNYSSNSKRIHKNYTTVAANDDDDDVEIGNYIIDSEEMNEEYF
ncbi:unnamed protein product [Schistosoma rodhaini]|uniref:NFRKB winged helix-like domain-containing protein n=2 Tax=Schistosoma rodhaini TaxID=6188 RepID=A0AA85EP22_9TREM|nr:unnamed protein product [Schistosoma rodhaini]